jgi:hypothetical protein
MNLVGWLFVFMDEIEDMLACEKLSGSRDVSRSLDSCESLREDPSELLKLFELLASWDEEMKI